MGLSQKGNEVLNEPKNLDPVAWAEWNSHVASELSKRMRFDDIELELEPYAVRPIELPPAIIDLTLAVNRAAFELQGTSEKGDRIALQLLTALALFAKETGT